MNNIYSQPEVSQPVQPQPVKVSPLISSSMREMLGTAFVGALVGLIIFTLVYLLNNYVFGLLLCRNESQVCNAAPTISMIIATLVGSAVGLAVLARMRIYRPLLIVLAAAISLWSFHLLIAGMVWYYGLIFTVIFFTLAYLLFTWLARMRSFLITIIITIIVILIVRFALIS